MANPGIAAPRAYGKPRASTTLMTISAIWATFWTVNAVNVGYGYHVVDGAVVGSLWNVHWAVVALIAICALSSIAAVVLLAKQRYRWAKWAMVVAGVTGLWTTLSLILSLVALILVKDRRDL